MQIKAAALLAAGLMIFIAGGCGPGSAGSNSTSGQAVGAPAAAPATSASAPGPASAAAPNVAAAAPAGDGRTYPGPFFLGRADAPVTVEEYADFQ